MQAHPRPLPRARGFTLLEILLVITAAMVLVGIGLGTYASVQKSTQAGAAQSDLMSLIATVRAVYPSGDYTGINDTILRNSRLLPAHMEGSLRMGGFPVDFIRTPWGGSYQVSPQSVLGGFNNAIRVTMNGVPAGSCATLVTAIEMQFPRIAIGGGLGTDVKNEWASPPQEFNRLAAINACNQATTAVHVYVN